MAKKKYIETPEKMWEYFNAYRENVKNNPFARVEQKKGNIIIAKGAEFSGEINDTVELPLQRPLTMEGFENYLFMHDVITDVSDYFENKDNSYSEFLPICRVIKRTIRQDQIEGGMAGIYNPSITQRLNNLVERTDATTQGEKITSYELTLKI